MHTHAHADTCHTHAQCSHTRLTLAPPHAGASLCGGSNPRHTSTVGVDVAFYKRHRSFGKLGYLWLVSNDTTKQVIPITRTSVGGGVHDEGTTFGQVMQGGRAGTLAGVSGSRATRAQAPAVGPRARAPTWGTAPDSVLHRFPLAQAFGGAVPGRGLHPGHRAVRRSWFLRTVGPPGQTPRALELGDGEAPPERRQGRETTGPRLWEGSAVAAGQGAELALTFQTTAISRKELFSVSSGYLTGTSCLTCSS